MKNVLIISLCILINHGIRSQEPKHLVLNELPEKQLNDLISRKMVAGEKGTIGYFTFKKGAEVPWHQHPNEQYSLITQGSVKVYIGKTETLVKAGEVMVIPPNVPHRFIALEDETIDIDFFTPSRMDWINGTDNYFNESQGTVKEEPWDLKVGQPEVFAKVDHAVGNIAFTPQGEIVYSQHPFFAPETRVSIYDRETKTSRPFPNEAWNTPNRDNDHYFSNVLGIRNDANGIIWILDMGQRNEVTPKIVGWNTRFDTLERIYYLPETALAATSQPNDMVVDTKHGVFIIADEGIGKGGNGEKAALIVVDMATGQTRRLLESTRATLPENVPITIDGQPLQVNGHHLLVGCDGITADENFEWLYFAPLNGTKVYRIRLKDLLDDGLTRSELETKVESYASKANNGGLSIDRDGNLYLTDVESHSISVILAKDRSTHKLMDDQRMAWPDGVSFNAVDGYMYVSAAQVHLGAAFNNGTNKAKAPYYIFRFKPLVKGLMGR